MPTAHRPLAPVWCWHQQGTIGNWDKMWRNGIPKGLFFDAARVEPALASRVEARATRSAGVCRTRADGAPTAC